MISQAIISIIIIIIHKTTMRNFLRYVWNEILHYLFTQRLIGWRFVGNEFLLFVFLEPTSTAAVAPLESHADLEFIWIPGDDESDESF